MASLLVLGTANAATVSIDLDQGTAGIQGTGNIATPNGPLTGAVVITGNVGQLVATFKVQVNLNLPAGVTVNIAGSSLTNGEINNAPANISSSVSATSFVFTNANPSAVAIDADGIVLFTFSIALNGLSNGQAILMSYLGSDVDESLGVVVDQVANLFPPGNFVDPNLDTAGAEATGGTGPVITPTPTTPVEIPTETPTIEVPTPTETTPAEQPCRDAGYYVLTSFGQHISVGNPPAVSSPPAGTNNFGDMEIAKDDPDGDEDLAIMDNFGVVNFVGDSGSTPAQDFVFDQNSPCGFAVDVVVSRDSNAFWVLSDGGGIFRGGDASPGAGLAQVGNDADDLCNILPVPFGGAIPRHPLIGVPGDGANIRAVGLAVVEQVNTKGATENQNPAGFIVMDAQGGTYLYDGQGNSIRDANGTAGSAANGGGVLNRDLVYPFFPGLDIARDIELAPASPADALVIFDGWGGIHPVPVDQESAVRFLRNETAVGSGVPITTVGMPYLITAFDDPTTVPDESASALDVNSIFIDIEFCQTIGNNNAGAEGAYTLDKFGGVFAFGSTRANPDNTAPQFNGSPYFFPFLYAEDMEPAQAETVFNNNIAR
ncbi:MAG: hypothetical protein HUU16_10275 [Candidatus Omnitrophica bacterium]|nr:hypothetical protein [Candidatus Omnitrophota bacterium]